MFKNAGGAMQLYLMYQDEKVAKLTIDLDVDPSEAVISLQPCDVALLPFSVKYAPDMYVLDEMSIWLANRCIPKHRKNMNQLTSYLQTTPYVWMIANHGASLQDGFWLKKPDELLQWKDINMFNRKFDYSIGNLMFDRTSPVYVYDSPDLTTGGIMPKTWRIKDNKQFLLKHGSAPDFTEPYNEKAASELLKRYCPVPFVTYDVINVEDYTCSICENFMNPSLELVTAAQLARTADKPEFLTMAMHIKERCKAFDIPNYKPFMDYMALTDYLIGNTDRNLNNYGFLYSIETGRFLGPAPIYDNGASFTTMPTNLEYEKIIKKTRNKARAVFKDFSKHFEPNLHLLNDYSDWLYNYFLNIYPTEQLDRILDIVELRYETAEKHLDRSRYRHIEEYER